VKFISTTISRARPRLVVVQPYSARDAVTGEHQRRALHRGAIDVRVGLQHQIGVRIRQRVQRHVLTVRN